MSSERTTAAYLRVPPLPAFRAPAGVPVWLALPALVALLALVPLGGGTAGWSSLADRAHRAGFAVPGDGAVLVDGVVEPLVLPDPSRRGEGEGGGAGVSSVVGSSAHRSQVFVARRLDAPGPMHRHRLARAGRRGHPATGPPAPF